ncbi:MAG: amidohydrolase family protein [Actinomycetota bacterium]|nr:amidohydrolase family protein [Actinomycetota bacterium]
MDEDKVEISIVAGISLETKTDNNKYKKINNYLAKEIEKSNNRLIGLCVADPLGGKESLDLIKEYVEDFGFRGLKLHPSFQEFYPNDKKLYPIYELMETYKLPILFHTGYIGISPFKNYYSMPEYLDEVACDFPDLPILLSHAGKPWFVDTAVMLRKHKNVYVDVSSNMGRYKELSYKPMEDFLYQVKIWVGNFDRVLFGSDYPLYDQKDTVDALKNAAESLNNQHDGFMGEEDLHQIFYSNSKKLIESWR